MLHQGGFSVLRLRLRFEVPSGQIGDGIGTHWAPLANLFNHWGAKVVAGLCDTRSASRPLTIEHLNSGPLVNTHTPHLWQQERCRRTEAVCIDAALPA